MKASEALSISTQKLSEKENPDVKFNTALASILKEVKSRASCGLTAARVNLTSWNEGEGVDTALDERTCNRIIFAMKDLGYRLSRFGYILDIRWGAVSTPDPETTISKESALCINL